MPQCLWGAFMMFLIFCFFFIKKKESKINIYHTFLRKKVLQKSPRIPNESFDRPTCQRYRASKLTFHTIRGLHPPEVSNSKRKIYFFNFYLLHFNMFKYWFLLAGKPEHLRCGVACAVGFMMF